MRIHLSISTIALAAILLCQSARAAERTVVLDVKNADCVLCPPIVRRSLLHVPGVKAVKTAQADRIADFMATVTFDDSVATVAMLIDATTKAGYPAHLAAAN